MFLIRKGVNKAKSLKKSVKGTMFKSKPPSYRYIIIKQPSVIEGTKKYKRFSVRKNKGTNLNQRSSLEEKINAEPGGYTTNSHISIVKPSQIKNTEKYIRLFKKMTKTGLENTSSKLGKSAKNMSYNTLTEQSEIAGRKYGGTTKKKYKRLYK